MRRSLVPGGTLLVLSGTGGKYRDIYPELDQPNLQVLAAFKDPLDRCLDGLTEERRACRCAFPDHFAGPGEARDLR
jgi:hypothetical protein